LLELECLETVTAGAILSVGLPKSLTLLLRGILVLACEEVAPFKLIDRAQIVTLGLEGLSQPRVRKGKIWVQAKCLAKLCDGSVVIARYDEWKPRDRGFDPRSRVESLGLLEFPLGFCNPTLHG